MRKPRFALSRADGSPIHYEVDDPPSLASSEPGGDIVLCDGVGCDGYIWKYLREDLRPRHRLIHPHYRGHGRSPRPSDPSRVRVEDHAGDMLSVLADAGSERAVFAGHSMGVQVCLEAYRAQPSAVAGLVLICGSPGHVLRNFRGSASLETLLPGVRATVERSPKVFNRLARTLIPTQLAFALAAKLEINAELLEEPDFMPYLEGLARIDVDLFLATLAAAAEHSAIDLLPMIRTPTLIIAGDTDGFTPPARSREMAETIPRAEVLWVEGGSHTAPLERPEQVGEAISEFIRRRIHRHSGTSAPQRGQDADDFD
jgi:pimeloyl-ACP methyl ester carboxylesterase